MWRTSDGGNGDVSKNNLVEDSWVWGERRYGIYTHLSENTIYRRVVARTDAGAKFQDDPVSPVAVYASAGTIVENSISIDMENSSCDGGGDVYAFYVTPGS